MATQLEQLEPISPLFDIEDRGFRVRAFYVPETLNDSNMAHVCITRDGNLRYLGYYEGYRIFNLAAHFQDFVDVELWKEEPADQS